MPVPLPDDAKKLVASGVLGHLVTLRKDGSPHATCAWVGIENDELLMGTLFDQAKLRNIRRDPRVTVSFETRTLNEYGLIEYLVIEGRGRVEEGGAADLLQSLAHVYLGPNVKFPPMVDPPPGFITRITPERVGGVGPWTAS